MNTVTTICRCGNSLITDKPKNGQVLTAECDHCFSGGFVNNFTNEITHIKTRHIISHFIQSKTPIVGKVFQVPEKVSKKHPGQEKTEKRMKGKVTILQDDALRFAAACEIVDVTLKDNRVVGDSVKILLDYAKTDDLIKIGTLIATKAGLPAGAKPSPAEVKEKPAKAAK